jgi:hypothetical protein
MEQVQVFADGAGQTVSDSAGLFTFKFPEKQAILDNKQNRNEEARKESDEALKT